MNTPVMRKTTRDEKIVRPGVYEVSVEQEEQEPFDMDDHPPHRLCECRKCMEYFTPLPDCDAFAAFGKPMQEPVACGWEKPCDKLKATQESLREHMEEIHNLRKQVAALKAVLDAWNNVEQEPVAWLRPACVDNFATHNYKTCERTDYGAFPTYAAPVRTKDLTDDEIVYVIEYYDDEWDETTFAIARAVVEKFKEKNK